MQSWFRLLPPPHNHFVSYHSTCSKTKVVQILVLPCLIESRSFTEDHAELASGYCYLFVFNWCYLTCLVRSTTHQHYSPIRSVPCIMLSVPSPSLPFLFLRSTPFPFQPHKTSILASPSWYGAVLSKSYLYVVLLSPPLTKCLSNLHSALVQ